MPLRFPPFRRVFSSRWAARLTAVCGLLVYFWQAWGFAHTQSSVLDEGNYLLKGWYFIQGIYSPFQDYGFWTNQMPLSFLIPGWVQAIFGEGLRTGRFFSLGLAVWALVGTWLIVRRFSGEWIAAAVVWAVAVNPALIKMYTPAAAQVLIAAMLVGVLALSLGDGRPRWQVLAGAGLAGAMVLTRVNLAPFVPLLLLYIFWQHGNRTGWKAAIVAGAVIVIGHTLYWPGILRIWAAWAPDFLLPLFAPFRPPSGTPLWNPTATGDQRLLSFLAGLRFHALSFAGFAITALFLTRKENWKRDAHFKAAWFLAAAFLTLMAAHAWAALGSHPQTDDALGGDYCVFCFPVYTAFYSLAGIVLVGITAGGVAASRARLRDWAAGILLAAAPAALAYGAFQEIYPTVLRWRVPRLRTLLTTGKWVPGEVPLWDYLETQWLIPEESARRLVPTVLGAGAGILLLALAVILFNLLRRSGKGREFASIALALLIGVCAVFSPAPVLGGGYSTYDCSGDVIAAHETAGAQLNSLIPAGARIYWQGSLSSAPLLYLGTPQILPAQINLDYTLRLSGDEDAHRRFGFWTEAQARAWLEESDFALVSVRYHQGWLAEALSGGDFEELAPTAPLEPCDPDSYLLVYRRIEP